MAVACGAKSSIMTIRILCIPIFVCLSLKGQAQTPTDTLQSGLKKMTLLNHKRIMENLFGQPMLDVQSVAIVTYDGCNAMEAVGAMVVFSELMNTEVTYVAPQAGWVQTDLFEIQVAKSYEDVKGVDLLFVPGGSAAGMEHMMQDSNFMQWLFSESASAHLVAASGDGCLLIGSNGMLNGKNIACGDLFGESNAASIGAHFQSARYVQDGKIWTSAPQTGALDLCLALVYAIRGEAFTQAAMLDLEYAPEPFVEGGLVTNTDAQTVNNFQQQFTSVQQWKILNPQACKNQLSGQTKSLIDTVGILAYDHFFMLDVLGPMYILSKGPNIKILLINPDSDIVQSGRTTLRTHTQLHSVPSLDMLLIPGGADGTWNVAQDNAILHWIQQVDSTSIVTASVCTGAWVLGSAGLLEGKKATTHWYRKMEMLHKFGAIPAQARYIQDGKYWTSAGVSAGIDFSFALLDNWFGTSYVKAVMLQTAYHPEPVIRGGVPPTSKPEVVDMMLQMYDYMMLKKLEIE